MSHKRAVILFLLLLSPGIPAQEKQERNMEKKPELTEIENDWLQEIRKLEKNETVSTVKQDEPSFLGVVLRFVLVFGITGIGFYYLLEYLKKKQGLLSGMEGPVQILGTIPLMSGKFLQIVDVAGQIMILGVAENNVNLIQIVDNAVISERIRLWYEDYRKKKQNYQEGWKRMWNSFHEKPAKFWHSQTAGKDFLSELRNEHQGSTVGLSEIQELLQFQYKKLRELKEKET